MTSNVLNLFIMENEIFVLNPDYIIKDDIKRFCLYNKLYINSYSSRTKTFIHPVHALIFSFFTSRRSLKQNIALISNVLGRTEENVKKIIYPFIENVKEIKLTLEGQNIRIPRNILINISKLKVEYTPSEFSVNLNRCYEEVDFKTKRISEAPRLITFMLTNRCVTNCCYCYADTKTKVSKEVPTERIINIIKEAKELNLYNIFLIGGEVFLHKEWDVILKTIVDNGFMPGNISTKVPITNQIMEKLKNTGFSNEIQLSIDSVDADILKRTIGTNDNYIGQVKKGISILENNSFNYKIETVLTRLTATKQNLKDLYNYLSTLRNISSWEIRAAMPSHYVNTDDYLDIKSERSNILELFQFIEGEIRSDASFQVFNALEQVNKEYFQSKEGSASFKGARCTALNEHMFILPDGKVTICEQLYWNPNFIIGDINTMGIQEIWNSSRALQLVNMKKQDLQSDSNCKPCKLFDVCYNVDRNRCWSDVVKAYGKDKWDFPDPRCKFAPSMKTSIVY